MQHWNSMYTTRMFLEEQLLYQLVMYLPLEQLAVKENQTIQEIVSAADHEKLTVIRLILAKRKTLENSRIQHLSWADYNQDGKQDHPLEGMQAAVFINPQSGSQFVTFRGTPKGAWLDNAKMLIGDLSYCKDFTDLEGKIWHYLSPMQAEAMEYIKALIEKKVSAGDEPVNRYVIGHSKGGNQAQLAMMIFPEYFDAGISMDGPGMSKELIREMKQNLGRNRFQKATDQLYGVNAANDYVHSLGYSIIPVSHVVWFLEAPCEPEVLCNHSAEVLMNQKTNDMVPFSADGPGPIAIFMQKVSAEAMAMPVADRASVFMTLMALMQAILGKSLPVNAREEDWGRLFGSLIQGKTKAIDLLESVTKSSK